MNEQNSTYEDVNSRLKEIVNEVSNEEISLDNALDLFEEAVALGMKASSMMEDDLAQRDALADERELRAQQAEQLDEQESFALEASDISGGASSDNTSGSTEQQDASVYGQASVLESEDALD